MERLFTLGLSNALAATVLAMGVAAPGTPALPTGPPLSTVSGYSSF